jgi:shikimate kinase
MKIFLIGFMGSGKSVFGKKLAKHLDLEFADLDTLIEQRYKMTVPGIFTRFDEPLFRNLETKTLNDFIANDNFVLACGGGTPCFNNNMDLINDSGISIYLEMNPKALSDRLIKSKTKRPLLANTNPEELYTKISQMLESRDKFYSKASYIVDGVNLKVEDIITLIGIRS